MSEEVEVNKNKRFPWGAMIVFAIFVIGIAIFNLFVMDMTGLEELEGDPEER